APPRAHARARRTARRPRASSAARPRASRRRRRRPRAAPRSAREQALDVVEVGTGRHLEQPRVALDDADAAAAPLDERRAVGRSGQVERVGGAQRVRAERLRRLDGDETGAVEGLHHLRVAHALDRVGDRQRGDGSVPAFGKRREQALDQPVLEERPGRVVDEHDERLSSDPAQPAADRLRPRGAACDDGGHLRGGELLGEQDGRLLPAPGRDHDDRVHPGRQLETLQALSEQRPPCERGERLRAIAAEPSTRARGDEDRPGRQTVAAAAFGFAFAGRLPAGRAITSSSHSAACSSVMSFAYISSEARIFLALTNICFSPVERPLSWSRKARLRTTSASSRMSPVFILSRLCLNRRFQFFGISVETPVSVFTTTSTMRSSITPRSPTFSAFSLGTFTVMSLCRILIVKYSRSCPRTTRLSLLTTVPAPWCGYTTLSPTSNKPSLPVRDASRKAPAVSRPPAT